jgi:hypothetical protein
MLKDRLELMRSGRERVANVVVRRTTAEIAANSGVPPWLKASALMASSGQIQSSGLIDTGPATIAVT